MSQSAGILILLGLLASCSSREVILEGLREDLRSPNPQTQEGDATEVEATPDEPENQNQSLPIVLPATVNHAAWTHLGGSPSHRVQHPALSATPQVIWSAGIGQGNSRKHRITADPILADGRIFTLDSRARVTATSTAGATLWSADLTPPREGADSASGGGLAFGDGTLVATSGFGTVTAMDPTTGAVKWSQKVEAPVTSAPAVVDGMVYVSARDNRGWGIDLKDGRVKWQLASTPEITGVVGAGSPAVTDRLALFPFATGEVMATLRKAGVRVWSSLVSGERRGRAYTAVSDFTGDPVVAGDVIYAGTTAGRLAAISQSGTRLWTAKEGAISAVWATGGSVFLVSDEANLVRLDAETGARIWAVELPYYTKERVRRRKAIAANFGPVLAGGKLWVASSDGQMRGFNPEDGALVANVAIPGGAATRPIVVSGVAYIVTQNGQLLALR
nr:PQQ-binding-like beta-propeller repeat protein [Aliiroseovarius subalbicans]